MAVYPPRMAPIGLKLGQNVFQTIPNISFFDTKQKLFGEFVRQNVHVFGILVRFSRSYEFLHATSAFSMKNDPRGNEFQLSTTLGGGVKDQKTI